MTGPTEINSLLIQAQAREDLRVEAMAALTQYETDCVRIGASGLSEYAGRTLCERARDHLADALRGLLARTDPRILPFTRTEDADSVLLTGRTGTPLLPPPWYLGDLVRSFGTTTTLHCVGTEDGTDGCGVYVLAGDGCTSEERAAVCLVLASPVLLAACQEIRRQLLHCEASPEGSRPENVTRAADHILDLLDVAIDQAVATLSPRPGGKGGRT